MKTKREINPDAGRAHVGMIWKIAAPEHLEKWLRQKI